MLQYHCHVAPCLCSAQSLKCIEQSPCLSLSCRPTLVDIQEERTRTRSPRRSTTPPPAQQLSTLGLFTPPARTRAMQSPSTPLVRTCAMRQAHRLGFVLSSLTELLFAWLQAATAGTLTARDHDRLDFLVIRIEHLMNSMMVLYD